MGSTETTPTTARRQADGLRRLADMIEANPELAEEMDIALSSMNVWIGADDQRATLVAFARAGARAGATVTKDKGGTSDQYFGARIEFGPVGFYAYGYRNQVCERIVTGTREVTKEVPDPEALAAVPKVTVTETVEDVEWRCTSLLASAS